MERLGIALVGCGNMGRSLATSAATVDVIQVVCASDVDGERGEALCREVGCDYVPDLDTVLSRDDVAAVVVATPPHLHEAPTVQSAAAGRHVFCEKPLAPTLDGCDRIMEAVAEAGVVFAVGLVCRYLPVHRKVKSLVAEGKVGRPVCMTVQRLHRPADGRRRAPWQDRLDQSGGMLMQVNSHEIDFIRHVMDDEVASVYAAGGRFANLTQDFQDEVHLTLRFRNGGIGHLYSSHASAIQAYGGRLDGTEGSIAFPAVWEAGDAPIRYKRQGGEEVEVAASELRRPESGVAEELRVFAEAVLSGTPVGADGVDGRAATEIALAAYRSMSTGEAVALPYQEGQRR